MSDFIYAAAVILTWEAIKLIWRDSRTAQRN